MLKCPVCGNLLFVNPTDGREIRCPVAGCGGVIHLDELMSRPRLWSRPKGGSLAWAANDEDEKQENAQSPLRMRVHENREVHVQGARRGDLEELIVPERWEGLPVTRICPYAFANQQKLRRVSLPDTLQSIAHDAFADCSALEKVRFGNDLKMVDAFAFRNCTSLCSLEYENAPLCVMEMAFAGCIGLSDAERGRFQGEEA